MDDKSAIVINPRHLFIAVASISLILLLLHLIFQSLYHLVGLDKIILLRELFDLDIEVSIPTWYSQVQLLIAGLIASLIMLHYSSLGEITQKRRWVLVATLAVFLSIDEGGGIHERFIDVIERNTQTSGLLANPWTIYAVIVLSLVGVLFVKLYISLPRRTKVLLAVSAIIYTTGAFIVDMVGGRYVDNVSLHTLFFIPLEEGMELLGVSLLVYVFADYAKQLGVKLFTTFK